MDVACYGYEISNAKLMDGVAVLRCIHGVDLIDGNDDNYRSFFFYFVFVLLICSITDLF